MKTGLAGQQTLQVPSPRSVAKGLSFLQFVSDQTAQLRSEQGERQEQPIDQQCCEQH